MTTTERITPPRVPSPRRPRSDARRDAHSVSSPYPSVDDLVEETVPLVDVVAVAGPPIAFLMGPWLLLVLMLAAPFAVLFVVVFLLAAAAALGALTCAVLASPFLLVRRLRERPSSTQSSFSVARLALAGSRRISTRLRSPARAVQQG